MPEFDSIIEANIWIYENVEYVSDIGSSDWDLKPDDEWQDPVETLTLRTGDCEDMSALLLWIAVEQFHYEGYLQILYNTETKRYHMCAIIEGRVYEPTIGFSFNEIPSPYIPKNTYTLEEYLQKSAFEIFHNEYGDEQELR